MAKTVIGVALYLEMNKSEHTSQTVIFPAMREPVSGINVPCMLMTRRISAANPRRQWRFSRGSENGLILPAAGPLDQLGALNRIKADIEWAMPMFTGLTAGTWALVKEPLAVEVSADDFPDISGIRTPTAFLRRVNSARTAAGFPTDIIVPAK